MDPSKSHVVVTLLTVGKVGGVCGKYVYILLLLVRTNDCTAACGTARIRTHIHSLGNRAILVYELCGLRRFLRLASVVLRY